MDIQAAARKVIRKIEERRKSKNGPILVALDGRSGAGKSTLAQLIAEGTGGGIVVGDDFYSGGNDDKWRGHSAQAKADEAIDWKRMRREVLEPLLAGRPASWHPLAFDPGFGWTGWKDELVSLEPADVFILDGAYSARPELADIIDVSVLIEAPDKARRKRMLARDGAAFTEAWHKIWDSAEDYYFSKVRPKNSFDLVIWLE
jgi:uridine kinase